jgi:RNA polymerase sigma-70 factor (ECF subfamily)
MDIISMSEGSTSFKELYERYAGDVYRFSYWLSGDTAIAKDITSETFVRVWTSGSEIRFETVKAYLFAIARNLYLHEQRVMRRSASITTEMPDTAAPPDDVAAARLELERTLKALQSFPEIDRTVLIMRAQDDLTYAEIARATGLSVSAVKVKVFRTRAKLQALITQQEGEVQ